MGVSLSLECFLRCFARAYCSVRPSLGGQLGGSAGWERASQDTQYRLARLSQRFSVAEVLWAAGESLQNFCLPVPFTTHSALALTHQENILSIHKLQAANHGQHSI